MIETAQAFGVDIGGSGIKAAPVNLEKGEFAEPRLKILTPEVSTPKAVGEIVRQQLEHFEVPESAPVGIAFPAPIHVGEKLGYMANLTSPGSAWTSPKCSPKLAVVRSPW